MRDGGVMQFNFEGRSRIVIVGKRRVYKIPHLRSWRGFLAGLLSNMEEGRYCAPELQATFEILAKTHYSNRFGFLNIQEKVKVARVNDRLFENCMEELLIKAADFGIVQEILDDNVPQNYGYRGARMVKLDYGKRFD